MDTNLHHKFATLHQSLLHGKLPRSLHWSDIVELIVHLGHVQTHGGDEFTFVVGDHVPEETSFYEEVAAALVSASEIVLIGHGTGKSSAVNVLEEYINRHHIDLSRRVRATEIVDLSALTEPEIEAIAKRHMITVV